MDIKNEFPEIGNDFRLVVQTCHELYKNQYVCAYDGNVSIRYGEYVLATPTHLCKRDVSEDDLIIVNLNGEKVFGKREPTSELKVHLAVYNKVSAAKAVVHGHPIYTTAIYRDGKNPNSSVLTESQDTFKQIPIVPAHRPGSALLAEDVGKVMNLETQVCIMEKHGAVTWGQSLEEAYFLLESLERLAKTEYLIGSMK